MQQMNDRLRQIEETLAEAANRRVGLYGIAMGEETMEVAPRPG